MREYFAVLSLGALVCVCSIAGHAQQSPARTITKISGDVYRAQNNNHYTVFLVTSEGIVLGDPINREFAGWLKGELSRRFNVPVKYVLYSHHHWDHASGGEVFSDTADFVGHENMTKGLAMPPANTPLPAHTWSMDSNENGQIEQAEAGGNFRSNFRLFDANGDGALTGPEAVRGPLGDVRPPNVTYRDRKTIRLGGKTVEMIYTGIITHCDDMSVLRFVEDGVVFVVDFIAIKRLPFRTMGSGRLDAWLNSIRAVENLDFNHVVPAHGEVGGKADIAEHRRYIEELREAVAEGIASGQTVEKLKESIRMEAYRNWQSYEAWRAENIEGMVALVRSAN